MAGRPSTPSNILRLNGTYRQDRHANRLPDPGDPVGPAPSTCQLPLAAPGKRLQSRPLTVADRPTLEVLCRLLAEARADFGTMSAARIAILVSTAGKLGFSPVERARLSGSTERADPEAEIEQEFFG